MYLFILLFTLFVCTRGHLIYDNISEIAQIGNNRMLVIAYTFICSIFFCIKTIKLFRLIDYKHKSIYYVIYATTLIMFLGALFPYYKDNVTLISKIHVYLSMFSSIFYLMILIFFERQLYVFNTPLYNKTHFIFLFGINVLAIAFVLFSRVNGCLELIYVTFLTGYLYYMEKFLSHNDEYFKKFYNN